MKPHAELRQIVQAIENEEANVLRRIAAMERERSLDFVGTFSRRAVDAEINTEKRLLNVLRNIRLGRMSPYVHVPRSAPNRHAKRRIDATKTTGIETPHPGFSSAVIP